MKIVKTNRAFFIWPCKFGATELGVEVLDEEEKEEAKTTSSSMGEAPQTIKSGTYTIQGRGLESGSS